MLLCILVSGPAVADGLRKEVGQIFAAEMISRSLSPKAAQHFAECYEEGLVWSELEQEKRRVTQGLPVVLYDRYGVHRLDCVDNRMRRWPETHPGQPMRVAPPPESPRAILLEVYNDRVISTKHPREVMQAAAACYLDRYSNARLAQILRQPREALFEAFWGRRGDTVSAADICAARTLKAWYDAQSPRHATQGDLGE